jgi:hypothetical protein
MEDKPFVIKYSTLEFRPERKQPGSLAMKRGGSVKSNRLLSDAVVPTSIFHYCV